MSRDSALVQHMLSHPGHSFDATSAELIWKTRNKYESQLVEAACINRFSSCNISKGEVRMTPAMATFSTYIADMHRHLGNNITPYGHGSTPNTSQPPTTSHGPSAQSPPTSIHTSGVHVSPISQSFNSGIVGSSPPLATSNPHPLHSSNYSVSGHSSSSVSRSHRSQTLHSTTSTNSSISGHSRSSIQIPTPY